MNYDQGFVRRRRIISPAGAFFGAPITAATYTGPGDIVSGATAWWGLRGYNAAYATGSNPAIDVVDQAGANSLTVNILSSGALDVASISAWVTAHTVTTIKVSKLYDQVGTRHLTQATLSKMPVLTLSGLGSLPIMQLSSANSVSMDSGASTLAVSVPFTVSTVADRTANTTSFGLIYSIAGAGAIQARFNNAANQVLSYSGGVNTITVTANDNSYNALQFLFDLGAVSTSAINVNGTSTTGVLDASGLPTGAINLGDNTSAGVNTFDGNIVEMGLWLSLFSGANSTGMSANQHSYWGF